MKVCSRCHGTGYVTVHKMMEHMIPYTTYVTTENVICPQCKGRKKVSGTSGISISKGIKTLVRRIIR